MKTKMNKKILLWAFAISGFTALVYEVVWSRPLQLIFGSTIYAVSTILTTFLIGFTIGSYLFRHHADLSKNPIKSFALIQIGIGIYGFLILGLFEIIQPIYLALNLPVLDFLLLFLILITPATLFGATWPIINKAYGKTETIGKDAGKLYSWNSFGSFLGPLAAGFIFIPLLGIMETSVLIATVNLVLGIFIYIKSNGGKND